MHRMLAHAAVLTLVVAIAGLGSLTATAATSGAAAAQSFGIELRFGNAAPRYRHMPGPVRDYCVPRHAVHKAAVMGVRHARLVRHAPRRVAVKGWRYGHPVRVVFANARGCPLIAMR